MKFIAILLLSMVMSASGRQTENIIFVMTDGLRWQEVFTGAEAALMDRTNGGVEHAADLRKQPA